MRPGRLPNRAADILVVNRSYEFTVNLGDHGEAIYERTMELCLSRFECGVANIGAEIANADITNQCDICDAIRVGHHPSGHHRQFILA